VIGLADTQQKNIMARADQELKLLEGIDFISIAFIQSNAKIIPILISARES
jgi:hypothetical protein